MPPEPADGAADCSRRGFLKSTCFVGAALAFGVPLATTLSACDAAGDGGGDTPSGVTISGNTITLDLTQSGASGLAASGGFLYLSAAQTVVVNTDGTTIKAFSSVCPHEGQAVRQYSGGELVCPSHDSHFSPTTGARLSGPARAGLDAFSVTRSGNTVTVSKG